MERTQSELVGGFGGQAVAADVMPPGTKEIVGVQIRANWYIDAICLIYKTAKEGLATLSPMGGRGGIPYEFLLEDGEHITGISGRYGWYIDSLRIHTNKRTSPLFGGHGFGGNYDYHLIIPPGQQLVGVYGRADWYVDAIGLVSETRPTAKTAVVPIAPVVESITPLEPVVPTPIAREPKPKELRKIEGIGPKIADVLVAAGIVNLQDLSEASVSHIKEILVAAGRRYGLADPSTWPEQAALGTKGDWDALKALQKELKGGKRK